MTHEFSDYRRFRLQGDIHLISWIANLAKSEIAKVSIILYMYLTIKQRPWKSNRFPRSLSFLSSWFVLQGY